jgi:hypothetical protein
MATIDEVKACPPWALARDYADCFEPDTSDSPGAAFLESVRDNIIEAWEEGRLTDEDSDGDTVHEIADGAPDVYTATRWAEFRDLGAWQEEPEAMDEWPSDLTDAAGVALYQIAERLCYALIADLRKGPEDED